MKKIISFKYQIVRHGDRRNKVPLSLLADCVYPFYPNFIPSQINTISSKKINKSSPSI